MNFKAFGIAAVIAAAVAAPAMAHHSFAMFQNDKTVTLKGTVEEFEWTNPHSWLHMVILGEGGKPEKWAFEMASPNQLISKGWKPDSIKAGDQITLVMHPMKDGSRGGSYVSVTLPNGTVLGQRPAGA
jgi:hypothetical protein